LSASRTAHHLDNLAEAFDAAKGVVRTPFFFAGDISDAARPIAIDGGRELIARGDHREAIFWMVATYSRCQNIFAVDAPAELRDRFTPAYQELLSDLGIRTPADLQRRAREVASDLPRICALADAIIAGNPAVVG
jgi:hypothetical protein